MATGSRHTVYLLVPMQARANMIADGGDHDDNDENNRRGDRNWLWLPTSGNAKTKTPAVMSVVSYNTTKQAVEHVLVYA